jgi:hypothetical protein
MAMAHAGNRIRRSLVRSMAFSLLRFGLVLAAGCSRGGGTGKAAAPSASAKAPNRAFAGVKFHPFVVVDQEQGNLATGAFNVPDGWLADGKVTWDYSSANLPARMSARFAAPDGSAWVESFPVELFSWVEPQPRLVKPTPIGKRVLGQINYPHINVLTVMRQFLIGRYRGRVQDLKIVGFRSIPNLAKVMGQPPIDGDSLAARVRYTLGGRPADEEFFCLLVKDHPIASHSPVGTAYEHHRLLVYAHSMGAIDGKLDALHPLLGYIAASFRGNPEWEKNRERVARQIAERFNRGLAASYRGIAAAAARSRQISANSDAFLARIDSQRAASNQAFEQQRQASNAASESNDKMNDQFDQYIRGTEKMDDPYWGTSERSYNNQYHWTDGNGSYQDTNDGSYDPNQHLNGDWQLMQPAK